MNKRKIPSDFNYKYVKLDIFASYVRDILALPVNNWVKFNYRIRDADDLSVLSSKKIISEDVKQTFLELGRWHKEILLSLGYAKIASLETNQNIQADRFKCVKTTSEFYFHIGTVLDNLARIAFLINHADAPSKRNMHGKLLRHLIDFSLFRKEYTVSGYRKAFNQKNLKEIEVMKNNFQQREPSPLIFTEKGQSLLFPSALRSATKPWSVELYKPRFRKYLPLGEMLTTDFNTVFTVQEELYQKFIQDISKFENKNSLVIK